jgi:tripartite ATP-independent transporter DctP family solute receptor
MTTLSRKVAILFFIFCLSAVAPALAQVKLKFAHTMSVNDTMQQGALKFAELVKAKTNGEVVIEVYPGGQLGNDSQIIESTRLGAIDICMTGNPFYTGMEQALNVLDLPYLFKDYDHAYAVLDGDIGKQIGKMLEKRSLKMLGFMEIGFRNISNSVRPVVKPEDMSGLKIRVTPNAAHVLALRLLGAVPTVMAFGEVYMALQSGAIDGQENPITLIYGQKFYEVQKYLSLTRHAYTCSDVTMNLNKFNSLKTAYQEALTEALLEAEKYHRQLNRSLEGKLLKEMIEAGLKVEENPDRAAFAAIVRNKTQEEYAGKHGWELIKQIQSLEK